MLLMFNLEIYQADINHALYDAAYFSLEIYQADISHAYHLHLHSQIQNEKYVESEDSRMQVQNDHKTK